MGLEKNFHDIAVDKKRDYNMYSILVNTFIKQIDNHLQMSALDFVHCANSILEYPVSISSEILKDNVLLGKQEIASDMVLLERIANREDNFWSVYHQLLNE